MWYRYEITVERGTTQAAPERHEIKVPAGIIKGVRIRFPPGPRGQVSIAVYQGTHKMWPRGHEFEPAPQYDPLGAPIVRDRPGPPSWYRGDDEQVDWDDYVENIEGWHWYLVGFAPDAAYNHTVYVDLFILEKEYANPLDPLVRFINAFEKLIGIRSE